MRNSIIYIYIYIEREREKERDGGMIIDNSSLEIMFNLYINWTSKSVAKLNIFK